MDFHAVKARSMIIARELLAEEVRQGLLPLDMRLDVEDNQRQMVYRLHFKDVIQIRH